MGGAGLHHHQTLAPSSPSRSRLPDNLERSLLINAVSILLSIHFSWFFFNFLHPKNRMASAMITRSVVSKTLLMWMWDSFTTLSPSEAFCAMMTSFSSTLEYGLPILIVVINFVSQISVNACCSYRSRSRHRIYVLKSNPPKRLT